MPKRFHVLELSFRGRWVATVHDEREKRAERVCRDLSSGEPHWVQWDLARQGCAVPRGMRLEAEEAYQRKTV